ncbi:MAG TPA: TatD family hydrolase [Candidatus Saccharimonadales bacterium]|nr:TatD family hydrolase [Candidatus Saccharimonadales bacterium]
MIDVHCHLNFHAYEKDVDDVIQKAFDAGVEKIINVGTKHDSSQWAVDLAQKYEQLYAIVGVHPHHADKHDLSSNWIEELEKIAKQPKVLAIGEIGLDYFRYQSNGVVDVALQKEVFEAQIMLAHKLKLPLQIHNRHAGKDVLEILKHHKNYLQKIPGMFHCFAGDMEILKGVLDLGFYVGFDGNSTYKGLAPGETVELSELARNTPMDRIVTETDSPFLTPEPHRGTRNMPAYVIIVGEFLAKIKGVSFAEFEQQSVTNAKKLFALE